MGTQQRARRVIPAVLVLTLVLKSQSGVPASGAGAADLAPSLAMSPCHIDGLAEEIRCGTLQVFEDRDRAAGRIIPIHVALLPALSRRAQPDPLFVMAGGPGQGARDLAPAAARFFRVIRQQRDIVLVDLRGTGASHPLTCGTSLDEVAQLGEADWAKMAVDCAAEIDADPRLYTHGPALADLNDVRQRLGYHRVNLWRGSWGTRASLLFALRYPDATRTVTLDGAAALTLAFPRTASADAQRALGRLLARCAADGDCQRAFPDPHGLLRRFLDRFADGPVTVSLRHPRTHEPVRVALSLGVATDILRGALYAPRDAAIVLQLIQQSGNGDMAPLVAQSLRTASTTVDSMNLGATLAVLCSEDLPRRAADDFAADAAGSIFGTTYADAWQHRCGAWSAGPALGEAATATSRVPALILSGGADPITPPRAGDQMAAHFPRHRHVVVPEAAHNTSFSGCVPRLIAAFLATGHADDLDDGCVSRVTAQPFVLSSSGSRP